jgi:hypothetical protein
MHNYYDNISMKIPKGIYDNVLDNTYLQNNLGVKI